MKKKTIVMISVSCLLLSACYGYFSVNPIIIDKSYTRNEFLSDSLFNPINDIDFVNGNNRVIVYVNWEDVSFLPEAVKKHTLLECRENSLIEQLKRHFEFEKVSEGCVDTTAAGSKIYFLKEGKVVFQSDIIIENNISLFFRNTGWTFSINSNDLIAIFQNLSQFICRLFILNK